MNNNGQLGGFSKARDLKYFLRELHDIDYERPCANKADIFLTRTKKDVWSVYEYEFLNGAEKH